MVIGKQLILEMIEKLAAESDLIGKRMQDIKAEKDAKSTSLIIENRILPYPAKLHPARPTA